VSSPGEGLGRACLEDAPAEDLRDLEVDAVQRMAVDAMMQRRQVRTVLQ
jgi:hypothetical protein